jgi:hypothetical protein
MYDDEDATKLQALTQQLLKTENIKEKMAILTEIHSLSKQAQKRVQTERSALQYAEWLKNNQK